MFTLPRFLHRALDCQHATQLISQLQDRPPTGWEAMKLRWHLAACNACSRFEQQIAFMREAMRRFRT